MGRLRLGWLPDVPTAEQRLELCAGDEITSYAFGDRRIDLRQVQDPNREWARGRGSWRQRTLNGRRLAWRIEEGRVIVFQRIGGTAVWVTGTGFEASEVLRSAASLPADLMPALTDGSSRSDQEAQNWPVVVSTPLLASADMVMQMAVPRTCSWPVDAVTATGPVIQPLDETVAGTTEPCSTEQVIDVAWTGVALTAVALPVIVRRLLRA